MRLPINTGAFTYLDPMHEDLHEYRYEQRGELHGLTRVRGFTQDDAHLFCMPEQVSAEFKKVIDLVLYVFESLGFTEYTAQVSLRTPGSGWPPS